MTCFVIVFHVYEYNGEQYYKDDFMVVDVIGDNHDPVEFADKAFVREYLYNHLGEYSPENFNPIPYLVALKDPEVKYMNNVVYPFWHDQVADKNEVFKFMEENSIPYSDYNIQLKGIAPEIIVKLVKLLGIEIYRTSEKLIIR